MQNSCEFIFVVPQRGVRTNPSNRPPPYTLDRDVYIMISDQKRSYGHFNNLYEGQLRSLWVDSEAKDPGYQSNNLGA